MTSKVKVKAGSTSITGRFEINSDCSWDELRLQIRELFDLQDEFTLKYIDDEDELVTLGTHGELEEALKVTQKTGILRLFVESPSDPRLTAGIESFRDLLVESPKETQVAPKRKFLFNSPAQSDPNCTYKTARMDDAQLSEVTAFTASSQEASTDGKCGYDFGSPSKKNKLQGEENHSESAVDNKQADEPTSEEQYIPLVQLMVPPPSGPPPRPPPPSAKPRKVPKGQKGKGCYHKLAENVAVELASMNEMLHQKLRSSFEALQAKEQSSDMQGLGELEEDSYVFVNQQDNLMTPNEDVNPAKEILLSSPSQSQETEEESLDDGPCSPQNSLASDGNGSSLHNVDHATIEEAVHRVVQESLPRIVEQTLRNLQGLHLDEESTSSSPSLQIPEKSTSSKVVHKGIFCAECSQAVTGIRYKCCFCTDYDLCEDCEGKKGIHNPDHFFIKLRNHVPGIGRKNGEMVPVLKKFVYRMALKEESRNEKKEEKKRDREERKEEKRKDKEERNEEKKKNKHERKDEKKKDKEEKKERKKEKKLLKVVRQEEKDKRELKRLLRHERESATAQERLQNCLNAEFIADASIPDGTVLKGGQKFLKRWIVKNKGRKWNLRTVLQCVEGNILVASGENAVEVPFLKPDEQGELAVPFIAPATPGHYESKWQLCHHSIPFGPLFWCQIVVEGDKVECELALQENSPEPAQARSHDNTSLVNSAFPEHDTTPVRKLVEQIVPQQGVTEEMDEASGSDTYLSSEDTAEFEKVGMPSDSMLMTSPGIQVAELEWDVTGCILDAELCEKGEVEELVMCTNEDAESVLSDLSDEFMVVPVPPCFDPEAPLTADPAHVTVSVTEYKQMSESHQGPFSLNLSGQSSLETSIKSGPSSAPYIDQRIVSNVETALEVVSSTVESTTSIETTLVVASSTDGKGISNVESTLEVTSRASIGEENRVFDLVNETVPPLPEPLIPEPGLDSPAVVEAEPTDLRLGPNEPDLPITHEPVPAPEPAQDDGDSDDDDDDDDRNDGPVQPEVSTPPIATQPVSGTDEPPPVALQPEPSTPVNVAPTTVKRCEDVQRILSNSGDFPSNIVSDVLSTAIDAVASAGRAVKTTVDNFLAGGPKPQATATYNPEEGCEISVSPPAESDAHLMDAPELQPVTWPPGRSPATCLDCLMEMGFCDRKLNEQLLKKHNNNVALVVNELLSFTDNEWSTRRH